MSTFTDIEKAIAPVAAPLLLQLWTNDILPAIQNALKSGSPEIQIVESAVAELLDSVAKGEIAKLATL